VTCIDGQMLAIGYVHWDKSTYHSCWRLCPLVVVCYLWFRVWIIDTLIGVVIQSSCVLNYQMCLVHVCVSSKCFTCLLCWYVRLRSRELYRETRLSPRRSADSRKTFEQRDVCCYKHFMVILGGKQWACILCCAYAWQDGSYCNIILCL